MSDDHDLGGTFEQGQTGGSDLPLRADGPTPGGPPSMVVAAPETVHARRLVWTAVVRGLVLDDPWRHHYLRSRWIGC